MHHVFLDGIFHARVGIIGLLHIFHCRIIIAIPVAENSNPQEILGTRKRLQAFGIDTAQMSDHDIQALAQERARSFLEEAPTSAADAARIILDGVRTECWRILVGDDAHRLDARVRETPEQAYDTDFYQSFAAEAGWRLG